MSDIPLARQLRLPTSRRAVSAATAAALAQDTLALVLAGARGPLLGPLTYSRAKPAVPFGGRWRIVDFPLSNCLNSGIRRIGIATQYKAQSLIRHVQRAWSFLDARLNEFVELLPAQKRVTADWYRGTADAVYQNLDFLPALPRVPGRHHLDHGRYARRAAVTSARSQTGGRGHENFTRTHRQDRPRAQRVTRASGAHRAGESASGRVPGVAGAVIPDPSN